MGEGKVGVTVCAQWRANLLVHGGLLCEVEDAVDDLPPDDEPPKPKRRLLQRSSSTSIYPYTQKILSNPHLPKYSASEIRTMGGSKSAYAVFRKRSLGIF